MNNTPLEDILEDQYTTPRTQRERRIRATVPVIRRAE